MSPTRYALTLRALPSDVPPEVRLRRLLKVALRAYRLRCEKVTEGAGVAQDELGGPEAGPGSAEGARGSTGR